MQVIVQSKINMLPNVRVSGACSLKKIVENRSSEIELESISCRVIVMHAILAT